MNKEIKLSTRTCKRCGRTWTLRLPKEPIVCPKCKSPYWNKETKK
jgi:predicted Zn-ribbon and HTH transcriptional regulator